jgi:hypothetical protein
MITGKEPVLPPNTGKDHSLRKVIKKERRK